MPQALTFTKGHGTGNDFVVVSDPDGLLDLSDDQVAALCDRRFGIGADVLLRVVRSAAIPEGAATPDAEWFMDYRNADGSPAEMCGNGIRVFLHYLLETGAVSVASGEVVRIGTRNGTLPMTLHDRGYEVDLGRFALPEGETLVRVRGLPVPRPGQSVDVGNPHIVVPCRPTTTSTTST